MSKLFDPQKLVTIAENQEKVYNAGYEKGKAEGDTDPILQDKTVDPSTSAQSITADSGYDGLNTVTVNAMPTATQATPGITVNASGLITATATQTAGYVTAGTKSATQQLAFQAAKTITPTTVSQTAVSSGYYTGGTVTVAGDSNLVAGNIKSGVSIFGVNGTYVGSGSGGDTTVEDAFITGTISTYTNNRVTSIRGYAFAFCSSLAEVNFPTCTTIGSYAFQSCRSLVSASFPVCRSIGTAAFSLCSNLTTISFPRTISIGTGAFSRCSNLTTALFPAATFIGISAFCNCSNLTTASFPVCSSIANSAFYACFKLATTNFSAVKTIGIQAFGSCTSLTTASLPAASIIGASAFAYCTNLISLYLLGSSVCKLSASNAFASTPIGGYSASAGTYGRIYVPASLLTSYKAETNWTYYSSRFVGI